MPSVSLKLPPLLFSLLKAGKTTLSNFLAEATGDVERGYHPTQGARILEFEVEGEAPDSGRLVRVEVELWDCGGSKQ